MLSGALDRHPRLKIVIGHMGEALPFMLDRIDETTAAEAKARLSRSVRQTILDQVWITTSGFFTLPPFMAALMSFGVDRILFSVDYPFASNARARAFLDALAGLTLGSGQDCPWQRGPVAETADLISGFSPPSVRSTLTWRTPEGVH